MFPTLEMRHLLAVITLAESMNFTRAAQKLNITQSGFSKQISEIEDQLGFKLFTRDGKRVTDLTDAGRVFVEHARLSVLHHQRAIQLANSTHEGAERFLHVGHCPYLDHKWLASLLSVRLPLYPRLKIELCSDFVPELIGSILTGALDLAFVNGPPEDEQITAVSLSREPLIVVLPEGHSASRKSHLRLADLADDPWITFQPRANPFIHQAILSTAKHESVRPKRLQYVMTPQEAFNSVAEGLGVAIIPRLAISQYRLSGMTVHALAEAPLSFETALLLRAENDSRLTNEFARSFLKKLRVINATPRQLELPIAG